MPNWGGVLKEISDTAKENNSPVDSVRRKYLLKLHKKTGRNVIAYYSGWLQKPEIQGNEINDDDKNGFMMVINGLDCSLGLDLILHTPGGGIAATESIIDYLYRKFGNDIRVIVPQIAMSAGTMIACSGKSIVMGRQSNLGPIDPQLRGMPAHGVIKEFERAHEEIKEDPSRLAVWQFILQKYHPTFLAECQNAIDLSEEFVLHNLVNVMFGGSKQAKAKSRNIVNYLTDYDGRKTHGRHINIDESKRIGLKVEDLEANQELQDLVLTVHHCFMHTLANTQAFKIIENHNGAAMARIMAFMQVQQS